MTSDSATFSGPRYYDEYIGPLWFEAFAADLAARLPQKPPGDVLEIACGTGIGTVPLRRRLDAGRRLVATDLSKPMLDYARAKVGTGLDIEWREADALNLPFGNGSFSAVVCGFGFMFVPEKQGALKEARRVLADGGLLLFNVWDTIEENPHALANALTLEAMFPGDAEMRFRLPYEMADPQLLRRLLGGAAFREKRIETKRLPIEGADPRRIAIGQVRGTPRAVLIEKRGVALDVVIDKVTEALTKSGGDPYNGYAQAMIVEAIAN